MNKWKIFKGNFWIYLTVIAIVLNLSSAYFFRSEYMNRKLENKTKLMSIAQQQQELINRGHDIKVDGKWGPNTQLALAIELMK
jgi:uncharacterized protein YpmB